MDQERFDQLARGLASGITRRSMVRNITGAALGGVLVAGGVNETGAKKKKKRGSGKRKGQAQQGQGAKVAVCHYDADADTYVEINVSQSGWTNGHAKHEQDFLRGATEDGCCRDSECSGLTDQCNVGTCVVNNDRVGACKAVPTPGEICDGGTCNGNGNCACTPKTCAELGRTCGTAPDDGCGNALNCGPASVCGSDTATNCCGGRCCKANGISCTSDSQCCNGDCLIVFGFGTCNAFTDYTCAA